VTLACPGFNDKNDYDRQTPCDQNFLRKFARDTPADRLHAWFNRQGPRCLRSLGLFDPEGLFIGEASYLFVPDNDRYEDSDLLWFDEHNHPVDPTQVDLSDQRYQQHRCYKLVSLLHINRNLDFFFVVAARVVSGRRHECPILYELVEEVVRAVHQGVIKVLIVDRGRIDGERMGHLKQKWAIDTIVPLRRNMDLYADAIGLTRLRGFTWEPYVPPEAPPPVVTASPRPAAVAKRETQRQQTLAQRKAEATAAAAPVSSPTAQTQAPPTLLGLGRGLLSWSQCPVPLTAVVNREQDEHGQTQDWVWVSTSDRFSAAQIRSTYELRPAIEERHRQYKCFWDLTRMHSCAFSLVVNQALMVLLAYTLVQAHLVLRQRQSLTHGVWERTRQLLSPTLEVVAVYYRQRFCLLTLAEFARILLEIAEPVRGKLREKASPYRARTIFAAGNRALPVATMPTLFVPVFIRRCLCSARW
jgi:Transposase DDE domain